MTTACFCIHGFTGTPWEMEPLLAYLHQHTDWDVYAPILPGHEEPMDLRGIKYTQWLEFCDDFLEKLLLSYRRIYLVGFSMGGVLAASLASRYPVDKLVLLSASARYINLKQITSDMAGVIKDRFHGKSKDNELYKIYKPKFTSTPLEALKEFCLLVSANSSVYKQVHIPVFIAQGMRDGMVPWKTAIYLYKEIPAVQKELYLIGKSKHMICYADGNQELFQAIQEFLV